MKTTSIERRIHAKVSDEMERRLGAQKDLVDLEELVAKICLRNTTPKDRAQEARKPLFLRRYE